MTGWLNLLTVYLIIGEGVKFRWTDRPKYFHGRQMELNTCDSTAYTACFIISQSALSPHLFPRAPILVSPGSDWWSSAVALVEKKKTKKEKFVTIHTLLSHKRWLNFFMRRYGEWKTGKLLQHLRSKSQGKGTACVKCFVEFHSTRHRRTHIFLTNPLESVNSSILCSIRAQVHLNP